MNIILKKEIIQNIIIKIFNILKIYKINTKFVIDELKKYFSDNYKKYYLFVKEYILYLFFIPIFSSIYMYFVYQSSKKEHRKLQIDKINELLNQIN